MIKPLFIHFQNARAPVDAGEFLDSALDSVGGSVEFSVGDISRLLTPVIAAIQPGWKGKVEF